ncbi:MAG: signal peptide peptidase SppA [Prevotella sp.]|nr:signal peptide peptidase SppA [Prevotella sp.]MCM1074664.1 signal peptide peptidase SppA [Ruminococcus sp.]
MKNFFLNALSSFVGAWMAIVLGGAVAVLIALALFTNMLGSGATAIEEKSVLEINLEGTMVERDNGSDISMLSLMAQDLNSSISLETALQAIQEAKDNDKIKAIYLNCGQIAAAPATLQALRLALADFKTSGKKIYAYADNMSQGAYYVACIADEISLNPAGSVSLSGLGGQTLFYKNLFDKAGIEFQAVRVGKGKAAIEPYTQDTMSTVARQQSQQLMDTIWHQIKTDIARSRAAMTPAFIDTLINRDYISMKSAEFVHKAKVVDKLEYRHQFEERLSLAIGQDGDKLENRVSIEQLAMQAPNYPASQSNQIAVLYACGGIDDFMGGGGINSTVLVPKILELADDDNVKALVLRVNSPGGSAFGSEQIWEALQTFKKTGKPFIVSMGDYAASGGYYISCGADRIFANPLCITGSIGIFGLIPDIDGLMNKLGVNVETVATNPAGQFPTLFSPLTEQQLAAMQSMVENGYELFVSRCAEGRKINVDKIKSIADGRPLPAVMAKSYGLIDELGSLDDAIEYAAKRAKLKDYCRVNYPEIDTSILTLLHSMQSGATKMATLTDLFTKGNVAEYANRARGFINSLCETDMIRTEAPTFFLTL